MTPELKDEHQSSALMSQIASALLLFTVAAFAAKAYFHPEVQARYLPLVIAHAGLMLAWLGLLVVQPWLITAKYLRLHRIIGSASLGLVGTMAVSGGIIAVNIGRELGRPEVTIVNIAAFVTFVPLYFLALHYARAKQLHQHRQAMLIATLALMTPAYARIVQVLGLPDPLAIAVQVPITFVIALAYDWRTRQQILRQTVQMLAFSFAVIAVMVAVLAVWFL